MIKNIVFDFGGVIADISREQAVKAFIRLGVKDADRILDKYHQTGIFQELEEGSLTEEAYRNELGKLCGRTLSWEEVQQAWLGFITGVDIHGSWNIWKCYVAKDTSSMYLATRILT